MTDTETSVVEKALSVTNSNINGSNNIQTSINVTDGCTFKNTEGATVDLSSTASQLQSIQQLGTVSSESTMDDTVLSAVAQESTASGSGLLSIGFSGAFNSAITKTTAGASISSTITNVINSTNTQTASINCSGNGSSFENGGTIDMAILADQSLTVEQNIVANQKSDISSDVASQVTQSASATMESGLYVVLAVIGVILLLMFGRPIMQWLQSKIGNTGGASVAGGTAVTSTSTKTGDSLYYGILMLLGGAAVGSAGVLGEVLSDPCNNSSQCKVDDTSTSYCTCTNHYTCGVDESHTTEAIPVSAPPQMFLWSVFEETEAFLYNASIRRMAVRKFAGFSPDNQLMSNSGMNVGVYVKMKDFCVGSGATSKKVPQKAMQGLLRYFRRVAMDPDLLNVRTDNDGDNNWTGVGDGRCTSSLADVLIPIVPFHLHNQFLPPPECNAFGNKYTDYKQTDASLGEVSTGLVADNSLNIGLNETFGDIFAATNLAQENSLSTLESFPQHRYTSTSTTIRGAPNLLRPTCYRENGTVGEDSYFIEYFEREQPTDSCPTNDGWKPMWLTPAAATNDDVHLAVINRSTGTVPAEWSSINDIIIEDERDLLFIRKARLGGNLASGNNVANNFTASDGCTVAVDDFVGAQNGVVPLWQTFRPQCSIGNAKSYTECRANSGDGYTSNEGFSFGYLAAYAKSKDDGGEGRAYQTPVCQQVAADSDQTVFFVNIDNAATPLEYSATRSTKAGLAGGSGTIEVGKAYGDQMCAEAMGYHRAPTDNSLNRFDAANWSERYTKSRPFPEFSASVIKDPDNEESVKMGLTQPTLYQLGRLDDLLVDTETWRGITETNDLVVAVAGKTILDGVIKAAAAPAVTGCHFQYDEEAGNVRECSATQPENCWTELLCEVMGGEWTATDAENGYYRCRPVADLCESACSNCKSREKCEGQEASGGCSWIEGAGEDGAGLCVKGCSPASGVCSSCGTDDCIGTQYCQKRSWMGDVSGQERSACAPRRGACGVAMNDEDTPLCAVDKNTKQLVDTLNYDFVLCRIPTPFMTGPSVAGITTVNGCLPAVFQPNPDSSAHFSINDSTCDTGTNCYSDEDTGEIICGTTHIPISSASPITANGEVEASCTYETNLDDTSASEVREGCYFNGSKGMCDTDAAEAAGISRTKTYFQGRRIGKVDPYCYFQQNTGLPSTEDATNFVCVNNEEQDRWMQAQAGDERKLVRWFMVNRIFNSILLFNDDPDHFSLLGLSTFMNGGGEDDAGQPVYPLTEAGLQKMADLTDDSAAHDVYTFFHAQPLLLQTTGSSFEFHTLKEIHDDFASLGGYLHQLQNFVYNGAKFGTDAGEYTDITAVDLARVGLGIGNLDKPDDLQAAFNALSGYSGKIFGAMGVCRHWYNEPAFKYSTMGVGAAIALAGVAYMVGENMTS